jgi:hypothetical protein
MLLIFSVLKSHFIGPFVISLSSSSPPPKKSPNVLTSPAIPSINFSLFNVVAKFLNILSTKYSSTISSKYFSVNAPIYSTKSSVNSLSFASSISFTLF